MQQPRRQSQLQRGGFTLVELLIVIVVIATLAAITIVSFGSIQSRAYDSTVQSDLRQAADMIEQYRVVNGQYPTANTTSLRGDLPGFRASKGSYAAQGTVTYNLNYCTDQNATAFGLAAYSKSGNQYAVSNRDTGVYRISGLGSWDNVCQFVLGVDFYAANYAASGYNANDTTNGPWRAWAGGN